METEKKSHGALIGSIIVIVLLIVGGIYIWQTKGKEIQLENEKVKQQLSDLNSGNINELNNLEQEASVIDTDIGINTINAVE